MKERFQQGEILYSSHARREMRQESFGPIGEWEVAEAVACCELLEEYPDDEPYPSCLLLGWTMEERPIHLVAAADVGGGRAIVVTVYQPDPVAWIDLRRRR